MPRAIAQIVSNRFAEIARLLPAAVGEIVEDTLFEIEATAKDLVPVDTGTLKNSIQTEPETRASGVVYTPVDYSIFVEYGTVKMGAQPYMTPAAEQARPRFLARMADLEKHLRP